MQSASWYAVHDYETNHEKGTLMSATMTSGAYAEVLISSVYHLGGIYMNTVRFSSKEDGSVSATYDVDGDRAGIYQSGRVLVYGLKPKFAQEACDIANARLDAKYPRKKANRRA